MAVWGSIDPNACHTCFQVQEAIWPELIFAAAPDVDKAQFTPSGFLHTEYPPVRIALNFFQSM
jgi:hypothetical protein